MKRVLLLSDSIRLGYEPYVREQLSGRAHVLAPVENGQHTVNQLLYFCHWVVPVQPDIVHLNAGLWDTRRVTVGGPDNVVPLEFYTRNVRRLLELLRQHTTAKIIWATTTPVHQANYDRINAQRSNAGRHGPDIDDYNRAAIAEAHALDIAINDLHGFVVQAGAASLLADDGIHYTTAGYQALATAVANKVRSFF